jgi:hypothetical protein
MLTAEVEVSGDSIWFLDMGQGLSDRRGVNTGQALADLGAAGRWGCRLGWSRLRSSVPVQQDRGVGGQ